jgi:hypothetical protein
MDDMYNNIESYIDTDFISYDTEPLILNPSKSISLSDSAEYPVYFRNRYSILSLALNTQYDDLRIIDMDDNFFSVVQSKDIIRYI